MRIFTYCGALLLGAVLVSYSFSGGNSKPVPGLSSFSEVNRSVSTSGDGPYVNSAPASEHTASTPSSSSPAPSPVPESEDASIRIKNNILTLGEDLESLLAKLGTPGRIAETEYDFDYYVYNMDYCNLAFIAIKEELIVGFYTDSLYFNYMGITPESDIYEVNQVFDSKFTLDEVLSYNTDSFTAKILMDVNGSEKVTGIYLLNNELKENGFDDEVVRSIELLNYDLANSIRARNNLPLLSWSSSAAIASRKHSSDMADKDYFDHISPDGSLPGDRLREEGISFQNVGENIIGGYGTAIHSSHAWFNSPGHRKNLLNPDFISLGVGFTYREDSSYKTYMTQEFFR